MYHPVIPIERLHGSMRSSIGKYTDYPYSSINIVQIGAGGNGGYLV